MEVPEGSARSVPVLEERRLVSMTVSEALILGSLSPGEHGPGYRIKGSGIPLGSHIVSASHDPATGSVTIVVSHPDFRELGPGEDPVAIAPRAVRLVCEGTCEVGCGEVGCGEVPVQGSGSS